MIALLALVGMEAICLIWPDLPARLPSPLRSLAAAALLSGLAALALADGSRLAASIRFRDSAIYMILIAVALRHPIANARAYSEIAEGLANRPLEAALYLVCFLALPIGVVAFPIFNLGRARSRE